MSFLSRGIAVALCLTSAAHADEPDFSPYATKAPWVVSPEKVASASKGKPQSNFDEQKVPAWTLPELLATRDGQPIATAAQWNERRQELLETFRSEMFGVSPPRPADLAFEQVELNPNAMGGAATLKRVLIRFSIAGKPFSFHLTLFLPNQRTGPAPVFLLLNHRAVENTDPTREQKFEFWPAEYVVSRGYAMAAINVAAEVDPDRKGATTGVRAFYREHHPQADQFTWATLAAWAWSGSRGVDYFETDPDIDTRRIAVIGHSRTGKTALWAAAQDERFALACVNGAGEGGPALARRHFGETLGQITKNFPYWFTPKYASFADRIIELPVDSHQLIALVAPRGYHGGDGSTDLWADPRGSWLALVEASRVWSLFDKQPPLKDEMPLLNDLLMRGALAYHIHDGGHALTTFDWKLYVDHAEQLFGSH